jgi:hypothetical protein
MHESEADLASVQGLLDECHAAAARHLQRDPRVSGSYARGEQLCVLVLGVARELEQASPWPSRRGRVKRRRATG